MKRKVIYTVLIVFTTAVVILATVTVCFLINNGKVVPSNAIQVLSDNKNVEESVVGTNGSIAIPGYKKMAMKAGQLQQNVRLINPEQNTCYMSISIYLPNETLIYRSGMLVPGQTLDNVEIAQTLGPGTYENAILRYVCYSTEELQELNGAETLFTLEVTQ